MAKETAKETIMKDVLLKLAEVKQELVKTIEFRERYWDLAGYKWQNTKKGVKYEDFTGELKEFLNTINQKIKLYEAHQE